MTTRGGDLQTWLADPRRVRRAGRVAAQFALAWRGEAVHAGFDAAFRGVDPMDEDAIAAAATSVLSDEAWLDELIDRLASELRDEPFVEPPFRALNSEVHSGLLLYESLHLTLTAGVSHASRLAAKKSARRVATSVNFTGGLTIMKFVRAGGATLSFWEAPRIDAGFSVAEAGQCRKTGARKITDGEVLTIDGRHQAYVIEHAETNLLVLQAAIRAGQAPVSVEYDAASGAYLGCSATDDGASRIQMTTTLLRKLGHQEAFDTIAAFLDHSDFFVRWHAMRELLGIDAGRALPLLRRMTEDDPHADARQAAAGLLPRVEAAVMGRKAA